MRPSNLVKSLTRSAAPMGKADLYLCRAGFRLVSSEASHHVGGDPESLLTWHRGAASIRARFASGGWSYQVDVEGDIVASAEHSSNKDGWPRFAADLRKATL